MGRSSHDLFSDTYEACFEAVDLLYIPANLSGRVKFFQKWPDLARVLFGAALCDHDIEGVGDKDVLSEHEHDAEVRRVRVVQAIRTFHEQLHGHHMPEIAVLIPAYEILGAQGLSFFYGADLLRDIEAAMEPRAVSPEVVVEKEAKPARDIWEGAQFDVPELEQPELEAELEAEPEFEPEPEREDVPLSAPPRPSGSPSESVDLGQILQDGAEFGSALMDGLRRKVRDYTPVIKKFLEPTQKPKMRKDKPSYPEAVGKVVKRSLFSLPDVFSSQKRGVKKAGSQTVKWADFLSRVSMDDVKNVDAVKPVVPSAPHKTVLYEDDPLHVAPPQVKREAGRASEISAPGAADTPGNPGMICLDGWSQGDDSLPSDAPVQEASTAVKPSALGHTFKLFRRRGRKSDDKE